MTYRLISEEDDRNQLAEIEMLEQLHRETMRRLQTARDQIAKARGEAPSEMSGLSISYIIKKLKSQRDEAERSRTLNHAAATVAIEQRDALRRCHEKELRVAWEAGFKLCRGYADNHVHFQGEQKERQWLEFLAGLRTNSAAASDVTGASVSEPNDRRGTP